MAFVYEKVREEDRGLFESFGFKNIFGKQERPTEWCIDREREICLVEIGTFIDCPYYYDLSYKGRIVRMEHLSNDSGSWQEGWTIRHIVSRIRVPRAVFAERREIVAAIEEAFSRWDDGCRPEEVREVTVEVRCEPEMVEVDYNGR